MPDRSYTPMILVIDDDEIMHQLTQEFMQRFGYRCIFSFTGRDGLRKMREERPSLVLLDYVLPDMDGEAVFDELMGRAEYASVRNIPVIMLTARNQTIEAQNRLLQKGIAAFLNKPFGFNELRNVIDNVLMLHEIRQKNEQLTREIERTKTYLERVLNAAPVGIFSTDRQGRLVQFNQRFAEYVAIGGRHPLRQQVFTRPEDLHQFRRLLAEGEAFDVKDLQLATPEHGRARFHLRCVPLYEGLAVSGCLGILEDITEAEKRAYEFYTLSLIGRFMQSTMELDALLSLILTGITAGQAFSFSRAMILLYDPEARALIGRMGVGPATAEEAERIWGVLSGEASLTLEAFLTKYGRNPPGPEDAFNNLVCSLSIPVEAADSVFVEAFRQRTARKVTEPPMDSTQDREICRALDLNAFACVPLIAEDRVLGVIAADNKYSDRPLHDSSVSLLSLFASQAALALEKAEAYRRVEEKKIALEEALQELKRTQARLIHSERLAAVGKMAAHVAHEIRNPLVTIGGYAHALLKSKAKDPGTRQKARVIVDEVKRLERILANVLDFARVSKPELSLANLNQVVADACQLLADPRKMRGAQLVQDLDPAIPNFYFDRHKIKQVLLNIFRNAVQSLPESGGVVAVSTRSLSDEEVEVRVSDNGSGIPTEVLENIFNPFFTTKPDGTGLGLAISQQIVHDHGGVIRVESQSGRGSTVYVTLPVRPSAKEDGMNRLEKRNNVSFAM